LLSRFNSTFWFLLLWTLRKKLGQVPPPVPKKGVDNGMVIKALIHWYETYLSFLKEAFRQAEADKMAIRGWGAPDGSDQQ
jgi:hypothetical protein